MKDVTSTSFGYIIAFLLPGLAALYALALWSARVAEILRTFLTSASNIGLFLLVTATALGLGLLVGVPRKFLFEGWLYKGERLQEFDYAPLGSEAKLTAYRAAIDETYRYHQFFGGVAVVLPFLYFGWLVHHWTEISAFISFFLFILVEYVVGKGALDAYDIYMKRARHILKKETVASEGGS